MIGQMCLIGISDSASKAAMCYSSIIRILDKAGVPPDERAKVLYYVLEVISMDCHCTPQIIN